MQQTMKTILATFTPGCKSKDGCRHEVESAGRWRFAQTGKRGQLIVSGKAEKCWQTVGWWKSSAAMGDALTIIIND